MTPSERERRIEAAARGIWDDIASRVRERGYESQETFETTPGRDTILSNARAALDAADEAVPVVSVDALLADDAAMLALSEAAWEHAGTAMPCSAEGGREGLRAALASFSGEEGTGE